MQVFTLTLKGEEIAEPCKSFPESDICVRKSVRRGEGAGGSALNRRSWPGARYRTGAFWYSLTGAVLGRATGDSGGFRNLPAVLYLSGLPLQNGERGIPQSRAFRCALSLYLPGIRTLAETEDWL